MSEVDQCWRAGVPVTSIKVLPARRQIAAFVINPHFKSKKVGAAEQLRLVCFALKPFTSSPPIGKPENTLDN